ncbi:hypothetical protein BH11MYX1_BH11MYX1_21170 [soil metagenome]
MSRTPLLRSLTKRLRDLRIARATGAPLDELPELRDEARRRRAQAGPPLSRRAILGGALAGGALLSLPGSARAASHQSKSVTIVGGGISGLNCALSLRDTGVTSTVYEASGRIGGRMFSNTSYWAANQVSEWCGELIDTGHKTIRRLAARYNLALDDLLAAEPTGSKETYKFDGAYYRKSDADADFLAMADFLAQDLADAGYPTTYDAYTPEGYELDHTSVYDWIESRVPGGHASNLGLLLDVAYNIEYGADTRVQSSLNLIYLLGYQPTAKHLDVFGASDERFHIRGGNQRLPEAIAADLGSQVVTGHKLVRIVETPNGRYTCTFTRGNGTVDVTSDLLVLAIPFAVLADVDYHRAGFDALKHTAITELGRGRNGKLQLQFDSRVWNAGGAWPGTANGSSYADTGYQASWDVTRAQAGTQGILVMYSGGNATEAMKTLSPFATASDPRVVQDAQRGLPQLKQVYPGLAWNNRATQSLPHKSNLFNASYSYWRLGQYTQFAGYEGQKQGGVYFCGEHTSQDFQGFMEGGALTGEVTAKKVARAAI